jgi:hypothetical protein
MPILAGIDGTGSREWLEKDGSNSHVYQFVQDFDTRTHLKQYFHGPGTTGLEVGPIVDMVCRFVKFALELSPDKDVSLIGHSRGGLIAILAAKRLDMTIRFLGLYDAVDMALGPDAIEIPTNVQMAFHARRHPSVHSRVYFGNTGTRHALDKDPNGLDCHYLEEFFRTTHGGIGGGWKYSSSIRKDDSEFCLGVTMLTLGMGARQCQQRAMVTLDDETLQSESMRAGQWMRHNALRKGVAIRSRPA